VKIKLLQWNTWYKEDPKNVIKQLKEIDADILCLQELTIGSSLHSGVDVVQMIKDDLGYEVYFKDMVIGDNGSQANAIFSRYPINKSRFAWTSEPTGSGGYSDEYRCYIESCIDVDGVTVTVGTTHMSYTHRFKESARKLVETSNLLAQLNDKRSFIFMGDLNVTPNSQTVRDISGVLSHAGPNYNEPTWTTKPFEYDGFRATALSWRLDYVFVSADVRVLSSETIDTNYSDHLPILSEIDV